jgi:hypothetical protein
LALVFEVLFYLQSQVLGVVEKWESWLTAYETQIERGRQMTSNDRHKMFTGEDLWNQANGPISRFSQTVRTQRNTTE